MIAIKPFRIDRETLTIYHTRGDTAVFTPEISFDGEELTDYKGTFSVKKDLTSQDPLFSVPFTKGKPIKITHDMTKNLPAGKYYWDLQIVYQGEYRTAGIFVYVLNPDVTY